MVLDEIKTILQGRGRIALVWHYVTKGAKNLRQKSAILHPNS